MSKRFSVLFCLILAGLAPLMLRRPNVALAGQATSGLDTLRAVTLIFGEKDSEPTKWDGAASISSGTIEKVEGYHFTRDAKIDGTAWQCASHPWPGFTHEMWPSERPQPRGYPLEPIGVTIYYRAPQDAEITVKVVKQGDFTFRLADVPEMKSIFPLRAYVDVRRSPVVQPITDSSYEDDYPSIAVDGDSVWVAWQAYRNGADEVFLRRYRDGKWADRVTVSEKPGDVFMTGVAAAHGKATVVWSDHQGGNWMLKARTFDGRTFGNAEVLTPDGGSNLFHRVASDGRGNLSVAYQSRRKGRGEIHLVTQVNGKWSPEIRISDAQRDPRANDWDPAVVVDRKGVVWVAWSSYATGSYNINLRPVENSRPGAIVKVSNSPRFHAHPSLAVDPENRLWVAYDQAQENWGKDVGFLFSGGTGLYESRSVQVAVYANGRWMAPLQQPEEAMPYRFRQFTESPQLAAGADGRVWLFLRPRTEARHPTNVWAAGGKWEVLGTYYNGDRWTDPMMFPNSVGRNEGGVNAAADAQGNAWVALVTDNKLWGGPEFGEYPGNNDIACTRIERGAALPAQLADRSPEPPAAGPSEPGEKQQIAAMRNYTVQADGKSYKIYRGDMHRHTEISIDGAGDGTLWDAYRYAMDAADLDFLVVTDHQSGNQDYTFWRIEKASDMFHAPGFFTAVYGTERSVNYPNGHRNLMYAQRGVPILDISREENQGKVNSGPILFPMLRKYKGVSTPHSPHTGMGTDWRDNDPEVDTIVEIWEGSRTSAESEGAPLAPTEKKTELWAGGYKPLGFVSNAWAKGYKIGVQASSDHASTHLSYACVIAENGSRESLLDAMRKRHTYAATTNILLDYRMKLDGATYLQGDDARSRSLPEIHANIKGTGPLAKVVIVRDNQYIYSKDVDGDTYQLQYRETSLTPGKHFYYVRLEQKNRHMAWSSPIWVDYEP